MSRAVLAIVAIAGLQSLPAISDSIVQKDIRVTLLDVRRVQYQEYEAAMRPLSAAWDGGGIYAAFLVENRPDAPMPPALGEIRVTIGSEQYNAVTNPNSTKPFAPLVIIRTADDFFAIRGRSIRGRAPISRPRSDVTALEIFVPGKPIPRGASGTIELEQGETHRPDANGVMRPLVPTEIARTWTWFRFAYPPLDQVTLEARAVPPAISVMQFGDLPRKGPSPI